MDVGVARYGPVTVVTSLFDRARARARVWWGSACSLFQIIGSVFMTFVASQVPTILRRLRLVFCIRE
jgi:hypothetical protein